MTYPRTFSHIGLSVTNLEQAVDFYTNVFGWYVIMPPTEVVADESAIGVMCNDVFGEGWGSFRIAHMSTGDKIGVEIFEFKNAEQRENNFEYWKTGVFHFCVQDPDVEGLAAKIVENGGKQRMPAPVTSALTSQGSQGGFGVEVDLKLVHPFNTATRKPGVGQDLHQHKENTCFPDQ